MSKILSAGPHGGGYLLLALSPFLALGAAAALTGVLYGVLFLIRFAVDIDIYRLTGVWW